ncbi:MAG: ATP-binding protein [Microcoleus sp. PH2017_25_DOB_D_A]|uniref:NB-ARC domain-containing protein n=1 Tax=unclassified Microcoleus TaxID=2642155 RepID=UPI001D646ED3|nr:MULTISPECIES: NB-ARC domain-containing protein [unclassified Microcoleus]TAE05998.1 MAG: ATPase [Oscillatoriales cyanobacterium]MCC3490961.1 ATP-binding protein [Microcoleus sp. PH2017_16_JOR_D_A]MCC3534672.1 ATP-binding protein [Microcoleus sp. PH2017_25_DOB_D_A]MCC3548251.1 ATP-binding protein [Microcoleus sp. PH2017_24_DOB_U_A]TAE29168.1 MAG: ATPase [Oscillatoriales cyanobacterium]
MDIAEVLTLADQLIFAKTGKHLDYVQDAILRGTLEDATYTQIAQEVYSSPSHVRNVGSDLWKTLSKGLKKNITKNNFRAVLEKGIVYNYQSAIVENIRGESITVNNKVNVCPEKVRSPKTPQNPEPKAKQPRIDLGDAPEISTFFDRTSELTTLENWILSRTRLITILGLSGIGKTALTLQLIPQIQHEFDCIIWRSLHNAPPLASLQTDIIQSCRGGAPVPALSVPEEIKPPSLSPPLSKGGLGGVIHHLRSHRCLIVLDDVQTIFSSQQLAGNYQPGYENYGAFFKQIAESCHNSCIILLSWEKPREIAALESHQKNCQTLQLNGLGESAREIFTEKGLAESENWSKLIDLYQGNPLWLNTIAAAIQDLFNGKVSEFLSYDSLVLGDLEYLLHQHFQRLSDSEKQVMSWLANQNKAVEISKKPALLELSPSEFLKAVESLRRRLLIEKVQKGSRTLFAVQRAIAEYLNS